MRNLSHKAFITMTPFSSWSWWDGQSVIGVKLLPRSCTAAANRTIGSEDNLTADCKTNKLCMPLSISLWYFSVFGMPKRAFNSGMTTDNAPHSRNIVIKTSGFFSSKLRCHSCQTLSGTKWSSSPCLTIWYINLRVSAANRKPKW